MLSTHRGGISLALAVMLAIGPALATDLNTATRAQIESVRGVGVELADRLLAERTARPFSGWDDLQRRVKGIGRRNLAGFSEADMRIGGALPPSASPGAEDNRR